MKKLFALLLLPSIAFAGKIGENYVGVELGSTNFDFKYTETAGSVSTDANGFSWEISGNYNLYDPSSEKYGLDIMLSYYNGSGDDTGVPTSGSSTPWTTDTELSIFTAILRPHYDLGGFKVFLDLGLFHQDIEIDIKHSSTDKATGDSTEFVYGAGFELDLGDKFSIQPSISWTESPNVNSSSNSFKGNDTVTFSIPVSYSYSENIDITASFGAVNNDDFIHTTTSTTKVTTESTTWGIGIDYKF
jgi:hypothetical protein